MTIFTMAMVNNIKSTEHNIILFGLLANTDGVIFVTRVSSFCKTIKKKIIITIQQLNYSRQTEYVAPFVNVFNQIMNIHFPTQFS